MNEVERQEASKHIEFAAVGAARDAIMNVFVMCGGKQVGSDPSIIAPSAPVSSLALAVSAVAAGLFAIAGHPHTPPDIRSALRRYAELILATDWNL